MARLGSMFRKAIGAPLKAILPKSPWLRLLLIALPVLLLLAMLEPVLSLFEKLADLIGRMFLPLLETPGGRLLLLNIVLVVAGLVLFLLLRSRLRALRSGLVLRRHMDGIGYLLDDDVGRARERFRRVARARAQPPSEFPPIAQDAKLKLARLALGEGDINTAMSWLARIKDTDLPKELKRSLAQLRAEAFIAQGEILPETIERDLRAALEKFPDDGRLLAMLRDLADARSDLDEVVRIQEQVHKHAPPRTKTREAQRLVDDLLRAGERALERGELEQARSNARRAQKVVPESPLPGCLLGRVHVERDDPRAAIREWGKTRSAKGLELTAWLLDRSPGAVTPRELLEACPIEGAVLLVAREYARQGDVRRAERAARTAANALGLTPSTAAILAEVLELCGRREDAEQVCREAVRRLLAPAPEPS
jgi:tetratricopeptide (TPR) repeat protein